MRKNVAVMITHKDNSINKNRLTIYLSKVIRLQFQIITLLKNLFKIKEKNNTLCTFSENEGIQAEAYIPFAEITRYSK